MAREVCESNLAGQVLGFLNFLTPSLSFLVSDNKGPIPFGMSDVKGKHRLPYGIKNVDLIALNN